MIKERKNLSLTDLSSAYRSVDFGVLPVFFLKLLNPPLFFLSLLLVQSLQVLPALMLLQHLIAFELLMSLSIIVLQIFGRLE